MALQVYPQATDENPYSQDGAMTNALREAFDGRSNDIKELRYYLRNDDASYTYSDITIEPVSRSGRNIVDGTDDYSFKLKATATQPTEDEWRAVTAGDPIDMDDISDTATYLPFWVRIEIPCGASIESIEGTVFYIAATQTLAP